MRRSLWHDTRPAARAEGERSNQGDRCQAKTAPLILLTRRRRTLRERPDPVREFQHEHAIVLTGRPHRAVASIQMNLRGAPIGAARNEVVEDDVV